MIWSRTKDFKAEKFLITKSTSREEESVGSRNFNVNNIYYQGNIERGKSGLINHGRESRVLRSNKLATFSSFAPLNEIKQEKNKLFLIVFVLRLFEFLVP